MQKSILYNDLDRGGSIACNGTEGSGVLARTIADNVLTLIFQVTPRISMPIPDNVTAADICQGCDSYRATRHFYVTVPLRTLSFTIYTDQTLGMDGGTVIRKENC